MKPIQECAEFALVQGLRCVQFRLPNSYRFKPRAYACALALRYGLIGASAASFALEMANPLEERDLKNVFRYWPLMVAEHYKEELSSRTAVDLGEMAPATIGRLSAGPLKLSMALRKQILPLQKVLEVAAEVFHRDHRTEITSEAFLFQKRKAMTTFRAASEESITFAASFFERRRAGLDEVSEIALLGE